MDIERPIDAIQSVGIVVRSQKDGLVITTSISKRLNDAADPMCIPWSAILKLKVLNVSVI